ncbi:MAG: TylF/MycF/NovP-related O-methyltransferase, partial [Solirubrobacteraceae bacterium]
TIVDDRSRRTRHRAKRWLLRAGRTRLLHPSDRRAAARATLWTDLLLARRLARLDADVVIGTRLSLNLVATCLRARGVAVVAWEHMNLDQKGPRKRAAIARAYGSADGVVVLTAADRRAYRRELGPDTRVVRIPNAVLPATAPPGLERGPVILAAGRLAHQKGFERLVRAFAAVAPEIAGWRLRICGAGPEEEALRRLARELRLGGRVELPGCVPDMAAEFAGASVFALSSRFERLPMVLLEAMTAGLPVVAFDCPTGPREVIEDGRDGVLVPEGDVDALAAALRALVADPERRRALGDAAARSASAFAPVTVGRRWDTVLADVTGVRPARRRGLPRHFDAEAKATIRAVRERTMTAQDKLFALIVATRHVAAHGIPGAIVECGVWRGGSMQAVARTLLECGQAERELHLFDTFAGMPPPADVDRRHDGMSAAELLAGRDRSRHIWAIADLDDVRAGMAATGYPAAHVHFHPGLVEETIPAEAPGEIALLRLDTDWYGSTLHELEHLYDRVPSGGVVVLDDYGYWEGARRAVDEFLERRGEALLLVPMASGRIAVKP